MSYQNYSWKRAEAATREAVQPPATPQEPDQIADFWREVERSYDIEPRAFFEREARPMGYSSAVAMAMHHMWKRDVKDRDGQTIIGRASAPPAVWQDKIAEYRALIVDMQAGTQVRSRRASELREVVAIQGTLRVLLHELDQRFPSPPTPGENR